MNDTTQGQAPSSQKITISGFSIALPIRFVEGHVCSANEAKALQQTFTENVRNNMAKLVAKAKADAGPDGLSPEATAELHGKITDYAISYQFAARQRAEPVDPIEREARKLARQAYVDALKGKGIDPKTIDADALAEKVDWILENRSWYREEAQRRHDAAKASAGASLDELIGAA